ncbi:hypothetical protein BOH78_4085, partial [Pichia kudriavzevii]
LPNRQIQVKNKWRQNIITCIKVRILWNNSAGNLKATGPYFQVITRMNEPPDICSLKSYVQTLENAFSNIDQIHLQKLNFQQEILRKTQHLELETSGSYAKTSRHVNP